VIFHDLLNENISKGKRRSGKCYWLTLKITEEIGDWSANFLNVSI
jgi:hypothetical protein